MSAPTLTLAAVAEACRYLDGWLAFQVDHVAVPGVQAAVHWDGEIVLSTAHGVADIDSGRPMTTRDRFRVASHSKTFTSTALHLLAERGELSMGDTIGSVVPELADTDIADRTLRELAEHTGGVSRDSDDPTFWALERPFLDRVALIEAASSGAVLEPHDRFKYSNIGYGLLGLAIEAVSGVSWGEFVERELMTPLGLSSTSPDLAPGTDPRLVTGHTAMIGGGDRRRLPIDDVDTSALAAATGVVSTAEDLVTWFAAHSLGDERLLTDRTKRRMHGPSNAVGGVGVGEYAVGLSVDDIGGRRMWGHGGGFPGHISRSLFDAEAGLAVSVLTNAADGPARPWGAAAVRLIDLAASSGTADECTDDLRAYEGRYASLWGTFDLVVLGSTLYRLDPRQPDPTINAARLEVVERDELVVTSTMGYDAPGESFRVTRDDSGAIVRMNGGGATGIPIDRFRAAMSARDRIRPADPLR